MRVSSDEFIRDYGTFSDRALSEILTITRDGRDRLVLLSIEEYERLRRQNRRVVRIEDFTDEEMERIAVATVPSEHAHLDEELVDRQS